MILANTFGSPFLPGALGAFLVLAVGLVGAFFAHDRLLETRAGLPMGRKAAALALGTHTVFSVLSVFIVLPLVLGAFL